MHVFLADQLTLSQPRGAHYAHHIICAPPSQIFRPFDGPKAERENQLLQYTIWPSFQCVAFPGYMATYHLISG